MFLTFGQVSWALFSWYLFLDLLDLRNEWVLIVFRSCFCARRHNLTAIVILTLEFALTLNIILSSAISISLRRDDIFHGIPLVSFDDFHITHSITVISNAFDLDLKYRILFESTNNRRANMVEAWNITFMKYMCLQNAGDYFVYIVNQGSIFPVNALT